MSLLRLTGLTKRYPGMAAPAVDDLSLSVAAGEILGEKFTGKYKSLKGEQGSFEMKPAPKSP